MPRAAALRSAVRSLLLPLLGIAAVTGGGAARGQAQDEEEVRRHGIFVDTVEVSLITLEIFASREGEPVADLGAEEFRVHDDGRPVEITHFTRIDQQRPAAPSALSDSLSDRPIAAAAATDRRDAATVILLVDQLFVSPTSRKRVFDATASRLGALIDGGARVMVVSKTREISVEQELTSNPELVRMALDRLSQTAPPGYASEISTMVDLWNLTPDAAESRQTGPGQPEPGLTTTELDAQSAYQDARGLSLRIHADVAASLGTLDRFLDSLAGVPGRKALVYVADRLPLHPAELLWRIWWEKYGFEHGSKFGVTVTGPAELDLSSSLEALISDANSSRVAFYPIGTDAGPNLASAASRGLTTPTRSVARTTESVAGDGLLWLSRRSGGRAAVRSGNLDALFDGLERDLASYYSISYVSPHDGDGESHRVEVRVARPGVELRYPTEYRAKSADQRTTDRTLSALTLGVEDNALDVRVSVGKSRKRGALYTTPLEIKVPMANLVLLPDAASHRGKLSIQLIARDSKGHFSAPVLVRLPFEVRNSDVARALSQTVDYEAEMTLDGGSHTIAVGVHDDLGYSASTVKVELDVGGSR
jgi:VWFA-related protein